MNMILLFIKANLDLNHCLVIIQENSGKVYRSLLLQMAEVMRDVTDCITLDHIQLIVNFTVPCAISKGSRDNLLSLLFNVY